MGSPPFVPRPVATASQPFIPKLAENPQNPVTTTNRIPLLNAIRLEEQEPKEKLKDFGSSTTSQGPNDQERTTTSLKSREPFKSTSQRTITTSQKSRESGSFS